MTDAPRPGDAVPDDGAPDDVPRRAPADPAPDAPASDAPASDVPATAPDVPAPAAPVPPDGARPQRRRSLVAGSLIAVLTALLGFAIAVQVRSTDTGQALEGAREEELVAILDDLDSEEDRLRAQIADQRGALRELSDTDSRSAAALEDARSRADALAVLNGTVAAEGPGLVITVRDPEGRVRVADLLDAVQELRGAGAETMQIDGVRVGVSTAVTGTPGDLRVDGRPVTAPYEIVVIGSAADLRTAMSIPGGVVDRVGRQGGSVDIEQRDRVVVDALRPLDEPQYAQPDPGD
ncbi:Uncharacterized conserved protein YlxW, UPF0749 family [Geodermatophilus saharensis]|uniref:Uncharacterized conserved protein YlxW, UPF0749 family n=1 Tax=Geodermatophilus saharensis TaxID=1137994 RepID=A0A239DFE5_9ACTN|nr:DUF881 domain-containing protein [Geodermatophilus saharensis]SNS31059.1 Uncharacterized conserved protein YlxW, UPF0749 family [Geodermatophilus saharensis]